MVFVPCSLCGGVPVWVLESSPRPLFPTEDITSFYKLQHPRVQQGWFFQSPRQWGGDLAKCQRPHGLCMASYDIGR